MMLDRGCEEGGVKWSLLPRRPRTSETSAARLLADTPSAPREPEGLRPGRPLAPTVVEWMPVRDRTSAAAARSADEDPLGAVGLRIGELVGGTYRIERALGAGGMGVVALATDELLDRRVAIKFIKPALFAFPEMRTFFHNEARAMARVGHPNVLAVYAFGEHEKTPYFVMEHIEGMTADQWLRARSPGAAPNLDEAIRILEQACSGVAAIHATATVHRDLKPSNLLIDRSFRVAVGDLGVARLLESATSGAYVVGSSAYMAPEAVLGEDEDPEFAYLRDIYALGCIAYELVTGRVPFIGQNDLSVLSQHVVEEPTPPSKLRRDLPPGLDAVILRALAKSASDRYASASALRAALLAEHSGAHEPERILIADDDDDWRALIASAVSARFPSAVVDQVRDGEQALAAFEKKPYSVVLVDLEMPGLDGARLTLLLRSFDRAQRTPIIVLTAAGGPREWQRLQAMGADAFLVKPVNADDVELLIRRTLRSRSNMPLLHPSPAQGTPAAG